MKKCAVLVCNEEEEHPVEFKWREGESPIMGQYHTVAARYQTVLAMII